MRAIPEGLLAAVRDKNRFVLATHLHPDADALGSLFGLADLLEGMGKAVFRYLEEPVSHLYDFMADAPKARSDVEEMLAFAGADREECAVITLDCGDCLRLGSRMKELLTITPVLVIDHHQPSGACFGDVSWIDHHRSSTGEMVFDLAEALGLSLSLNAATNLYTAIVGDTGSFKYESTSAHTFDVAGRLVSMGVRPEVVSGNLYDNYSIRRLRLLQLVLATLETHAEDRIAVIRVTREMYARTGTVQADTEEFIDAARRIKSVEVAVFIKATSPDLISVSLRSKGHCNVARVAAEFGGGGHRCAAGFRRTGCVPDLVRDELLPLLLRNLDQPQDD